jgi:hypothetical protein
VVCQPSTGRLRQHPARSPAKVKRNAGRVHARERPA